MTLSSLRNDTFNLYYLQDHIYFTFFKIIITLILQESNYNYEVILCTAEKI